MNLEDLLPVPETVDLGRGKLELRGLDATQVAKLILMYKDQVLMFLGSEGVNFEGLILTAPEAVLDILSMAASMEDQREKFRKMPVAKQIECLGIVYRLSVPDEKKFQESLAGLLATLKGLRKDESPVPIPSENSADPLQAGQTTLSGPDTDSKK